MWNLIRRVLLVCFVLLCLFNYNRCTLSLQLKCTYYLEKIQKNMSRLKRLQININANKKYIDKSQYISFLLLYYCCIANNYEFSLAYKNKYLVFTNPWAGCGVLLILLGSLKHLWVKWVGGPGLSELC